MFQINEVHFIIINSPPSHPTALSDFTFCICFPFSPQSNARLLPPAMDPSVEPTAEVHQVADGVVARVAATMDVGDIVTNFQNLLAQRVCGSMRDAVEDAVNKAVKEKDATIANLHLENKALKDLYEISLGDLFNIARDLQVAEDVNLQLHNQLAGLIKEVTENASRNKRAITEARKAISLSSARYPSISPRKRTRSSSVVDSRNAKRKSSSKSQEAAKEAPSSATSSVAEAAAGDEAAEQASSTAQASAQASVSTKPFGGLGVNVAKDATENAESYYSPTSPSPSRSRSRFRSRSRSRSCSYGVQSVKELQVDNFTTDPADLPEPVIFSSADLLAQDPTAAQEHEEGEISD